MLLINYTNPDEHSYAKVILNGIVVEDSFVSVRKDQKRICVYDEKYSNLMRREQIKNLFCNGITEVEVISNSNLLPQDIINGSYNTGIEYIHGIYMIKFEFQFDSEEWKQIYSISEISNKLKEFFDVMDELKFQIDDPESVLNGISILSRIKSENNTFEDEETRLLQEIAEIYLSAHNALMKLNDHYVIFEFDIDENLKIAYKQYLDYFVQFLKDIGIGAKANTYEELNKILFQVIPDDKTVALNNIRNCLSLYLSLVENKEIDAYDDYSNIAYMQLKANIGHLKSQLMLANAIIEQKQVTIDMLRYVTGKETGSLIENRKENELELFDGVVTLGEVDCKILKFNLGKFLKILFRRK